MAAKKNRPRQGGRRTRCLPWRVIPYIYYSRAGPPEIRRSCSGSFEVQTDQIWLALRARFTRESDGAFRITDCQLNEP